jgi:hypothetical protein
MADEDRAYLVDRSASPPPSINITVVLGSLLVGGVFNKVMSLFGF